MGGDDFKKNIKGLLLGKKITKREIPQYRSENRRLTVEEAFKVVTEGLKLDRLIFENKCVGEDINWKRVFIYICKDQLFATHQEISDSLGGIVSAVISQHYYRAHEEIRRKIGCYRQYQAMKKVIDVAQPVKVRFDNM